MGSISAVMSVVHRGVAIAQMASEGSSLCEERCPGSGYPAGTGGVETCRSGHVPTACPATRRVAAQRLYVWRGFAAKADRHRKKGVAGSSSAEGFGNRAGARVLVSGAALLTTSSDSGGSAVAPGEALGVVRRTASPG